MDLFGMHTADAVISPCGAYRYLLGRAWDLEKPLCCWVGLNPSTADATQDDATVRRMCRFAADWGHGGIVLVNLFGYRSTDPKALLTVEDPVGPVNDFHLLRACSRASRVVACWGAGGGLKGRGAAVLAELKAAGVRVECLGTTTGGFPRHPVRLRADLKPVEL